MTQRTLRHGESGIALVSALLILVLAMVMSATFMMTVVAERNMSSGTHGARKAMFAADAGVRTMQQQLTNIAQGRMDTLTAGWSGTGELITNPSAVFNGSTITLTSANPPFTATANITYVNDSITTTQQTFDYRYTIQAVSTAGFGARRSVQSTGTIRLSASRGSFADYLVYTNHHTAPDGGAIWFTSRTSFDGRVHTNDKFRFAYQPTFQDLVTSVNSQASYYNFDGRRSNPVSLDSDHNGSRDVPNFGGGFDRGVASIDLPANAYSQQNATLGLNATITTAPDNATINAAIGSGAGASTPPNGIYVAESGGVLGGIYVRGDLDNALLSIDVNGNQVYTLTQGSATRTITLDRANNRTAIFDGSSTVYRPGMPRGLMYVTGTVRNLRGPDRNLGNIVPALAPQTKLLVTCEHDIVLTRDITCENYAAGTNVLGLYAAQGAVRVGTGAPNDMNLDAFVMAAGSNGYFGVDNHDQGSPRGTFHLRGGMITEYYGAFGTFSGTTPTSGYGRAFGYDRRGLTPPYFPSTGRFTPNQPTARRDSWIEL